MSKAQQRININPSVILRVFEKKYTRSSFVKLFFAIKENEPRIIIAFNPQLAVSLLFIRYLLGTNFLIIGRSINQLSREYKYKKSIWIKYFVNNLIKLFFGYCDIIIAQSKGMKNDLIMNYRIDKKKLVVIYNPAIITKVSEKHSYKKSHEIIYIGRLEDQKGLDNLLKIFRIVLTKDNSLILRIIGEGSLLQKLIDLSISLGINNNVVFEGYQHNLAAYYFQAKATVLTSHFEGMPNALLESIYLGTPIISFNCPSGPSEIILHGVNGFLVPYLDNTDFAKRILETTCNNLFDPKKVIETSKRFHINKIINKYERLVANKK